MSTYIIPSCKNDVAAIALANTLKTALVVDLDDDKWSPEEGDMVVDLGCKDHQFSIPEYQVIDILEVAEVVKFRDEPQSFTNYAAVIREIAAQWFR